MSLCFTTLRTWHLSITNAVNHSPTTFYHTTTKFILHSHHKVTTTLPILISIPQNKTNLTQPQNHSNKIITPPHTHKTITIKLTHTNTTNPKSNSFTISSCQIKTMSDPTTTALPHPSIIPNQHHNLPLLHGVTTTAQPPPPPPPPSSREYRKGNWTIQETLILITAKKLDDERRLKNTSTPSSSQDPNRTTTNVTSIASASSSNRNSGELRWKWVENYCWSNGCLRSQNQCNDKWDNLLRDYKKVRDYESKSESPNNNKLDFPSYWTLNKQQRKEQNLPSNMVFEVYQAISDVLQRKQSQRIITNPQQQQNLVTLVSSSQQPPLLQAQPLPPLPPPLPLQQPPPPPHAPASSTTPVVSGLLLVFLNPTLLRDQNHQIQNIVRITMMMMVRNQNVGKLRILVQA
uniref:Uncharacterized protein LOC101498050 isoform X2 n=1 Tax=Cicer arietinum TaxID=3827 RepID=A0A3Q7XYF4_CICAR|nr:uncharacterized protein LOC101498050 isoform X2 [Cicer arietinum]